MRTIAPAFQEILCVYQAGVAFEFGYWQEVVNIGGYPLPTSQL
ncbi:hypothetical protein [Nostoc linckia]|nr:hypothetical protein [Nostoc linckia]